MNYNIIVVLVYLCGGFARGTAVYNLSNVLIQMYSNITNHFDTKGPIMAFLSTCVMCGSMLGTFSATPTIFKIGRKNTISVMSALGSLSNIACMFPFHWVYLAIMKMLTGLSTSVIMTTIPMLLSEFVIPKWRGVFASFMNLFICFGVLLCAFVQLAICSHDRLYYMVFIPGVFFCSSLFVLSFWVKENNSSESLTSPIQQSKQNIFSKKYRRCLLVALTLSPAQAGSGMNVVVQYAAMIFAGSFSSPNSGTIGFIIVACVNALSATIAIPFIKRMRRRILFFSSLIVCTVCVFCQFILCFIPLNAQTTDIIKLIITIVLLIAFQFGIGPLYLAILSEVFPLEVKTQLMNLAMVMYWLVLITITFIFPLVPKWCNQLIFMSIEIISFIVLTKALPETTGKTLPEIWKVMVVEEPKVQITPAMRTELLE
ncbi:Hexose_transporter [Hexamita inflata]|uniref:Hexose transporter n=1 Tax=Hexamita inflata TaxID=28002 RepID=A0AA86PT95_9EUKA|nr:Hexose transporter [Hexamita inflata]